MNRLQTARAWRVPPRVFWGGDQDGPFTTEDLLLMEALTIYEGSICKGCGVSSLLSYNDFNAGEFVYREDVWCLGCEELENHRDEKLQPGQKGYLANLMGTPDPNEDQPPPVQPGPVQPPPDDPPPVLTDGGAAVPNVHISADVSGAMQAMKAMSQ